MGLMKRENPGVYRCVGGLLNGRIETLTVTEGFVSQRCVLEITYVYRWMKV